jgi:hypothetical protein
VSSEFAAAHDALANDLQAHDVTVCVQRTFRHDDKAATLHRFANDIESCDAVVCRIGRRSGGGFPERGEAAAYLAKDVLPPGAAEARYTRWEFFLARAFKRRCLVCFATNAFAPEQTDCPKDDRPDLQTAFAAHVKSLGMRAPRVDSAGDFRAEVLKDLWPGEWIFLSRGRCGGPAWLASRTQAEANESVGDHRPRCATGPAESGPLQQEHRHPDQQQHQEDGRAEGEAGEPVQEPLAVGEEGLLRLGSGEDGAVFGHAAPRLGEDGFAGFYGSAAPGGKGLPGAASGGRGLPSAASGGRGLPSAASGGRGLSSAASGGRGLSSAASGGRGLSSAASSGGGVPGRRDANSRSASG